MNTIDNLLILAAAARLIASILEFLARWPR
jgi:hypothetical protein